MSDASTTLPTYFPSPLSSIILYLPLPTCLTFALTFDPLISRLHHVELDFVKTTSIVEGLKNVDKLFVLTPTHPKIVEFTSNLINSAKGVKRIVKLSRIRADAQPGITITRLHRDVEKVIEDSGIPYTFLPTKLLYAKFYQLIWSNDQEH